MLWVAAWLLVYLTPELSTPKMCAFVISHTYIEPCTLRLHDVQTLDPFLPGPKIVYTLNFEILLSSCLQVKF